MIIDLVATHEQRFDRTPDGCIWTGNDGHYDSWKRYLDVFDKVRVLARVRDTLTVPPGAQRADGKGVSFTAVPHYLGPWEYLRKAPRVKHVVRGSVGRGDAVLLRVPGQIAFCLEPLLRASGHPYGVEVVGDPYDMFGPAGPAFLLRPFLRWWFICRLRGTCAAAAGATYVTEYTLQRRYPCRAWSSGISDVQLPPEAFLGARDRSKKTRATTIITVGTLARLYKAPDILIDAVGECVREGLDLHLVIVGDGMYRPRLEARAMDANLGERVRFLGYLPAGDAVRAELDRADLFVLPSRAEGLPRALLEAMARGLPCIGSTVGGIPELLPPEDMVPPDDMPSLSRKIREVVADPERMARMSERNVAKSGEYREEVLRDLRLRFYGHLRETTECWARGGR